MMSVNRGRVDPCIEDAGKVPPVRGNKTLNQGIVTG
jgi:hypothetical protein